jgi:hypothetical protein
MGNLDSRTIDRIKKKAEQSICKLRVAALGFNKAGVCVATSTNRPRFNRHGGSEHAEALVMKDARKKGIVRILICRIGAGGALRPIDPCPNCQTIADKLGIVIETVPEENEQ